MIVHTVQTASLDVDGDVPRRACDHGEEFTRRQKIVSSAASEKQRDDVLKHRLRAKEFEQKGVVNGWPLD